MVCSLTCAKLESGYNMVQLYCTNLKNLKEFLYVSIKFLDLSDLSDLSLAQPERDLDGASNEAWEAASVVAPAPNWSGPLEITVSETRQKVQSWNCPWTDAAGIVHGREMSGGFFVALWQNPRTVQVFSDGLSFAVCYILLVDRFRAQVVAWFSWKVRFPLPRIQSSIRWQVLWKAPVTHLSIRILSHVMSCPCCSLFIEWILVRLCTSDTGIHKKAGTYLAEQTHYQPPKWASLDKLPSLSSFCWKWEAWHEDSNSMQFYLLDTALKLSFWHPREIGLSIQEYPGHRNIQSIRLHRVLCAILHGLTMS